MVKILKNAFDILEDNEIYVSMNKFYIRANEEGIKKTEMISNIVSGIKLGGRADSYFDNEMKKLTWEMLEDERMDSEEMERALKEAHKISKNWEAQKSKGKSILDDETIIWTE